MQTLSYLELKVYTKAENLCESMFEFLKSRRKINHYELRDRFRTNAISTLSLIKKACSKIPKKEKFIECMSEVILNNTELGLLLDEALESGYMSEIEYSKFNADCIELRELELSIINNANIYFKNGEAPGEWLN